MFPRYVKKDVPDDWHLSNLGQVARLQGGFTFSSEDYVDKGVRLLKIANVSHGFMDWSEASFLPLSYWKENPEFQVSEGDIVIAMTRPIISGGLKISLFSSNEKCLLNQRVGRFRVGRNLDRDYLYYFMNQRYFTDQIEFRINEMGQPNISAKEVEDIKIWYPSSILEQQKIASILSKVDDLIQKTGKIIERAQRLKISLMQRLFTRGIGHTKFKEIYFHNKQLNIPEKWEVVKLKDNTFKIGSGVTPLGGSRIYEEKGIPFIRSQNVHFDRLHLDDIVYITGAIHDDMSSTKLQPYDVLLNITGASIGRCNYVPPDFGEGNVNQHVCIIRPKGKLNPIFLAKFLSTPLMQGLINSKQGGLSRQGLTFKEIGNMSVICPPIEEQKRIADILSNVEMAIESEHGCKRILETLKKGLMQKLLTGQIRVKV